jgi:predicted CXXCH cytochrome family protein
MLILLFSAPPLSLTAGSQSAAAGIEERHDSPAQGLDCRICHKTAINAAPLGKASLIAEVCFSCHRRDEEVRPSFDLPAGFPPAVKGNKACETCHYPDKSSPRRQSVDDGRYLRSEGPTKQFCADCHSKTSKGKPSQPQSH